MDEVTKSGEIKQAEVPEAEKEESVITERLNRSKWMFLTMKSNFPVIIESTLGILWKVYIVNCNSLLYRPHLAEELTVQPNGGPMRDVSMHDENRLSKWMRF